MIVVVVVACSILHGHCRDFQLPQLAERVTPFECQLYGQHALVQWRAAHPNWSISRWSCVRSVHLKAKA